MFVRRVAGPSRLAGHAGIPNAQTKVRMRKDIFEMLSGRAQQSQTRASSSGSANVPAPVASTEMTAEEQIEKAMSEAAKVDRIGSRGAARQNMNEFPLPIQDVALIPSRPSGMKELYLGYYPADITQWPFFHRKLWNPKNWDRKGILRPWNPLNWTISSLNPIAHFKEWRENGPKALELWLARVKNDRHNFDGMAQMAKYQRFVDYTWPATRLVDRESKWPWSDLKQRKLEDETFSDLSAGENSPLRRILLDAADVYIAMNTAVSEGNSSNLASYADKTYLTELETRAKRISDSRRLDNPVNYEWEFGHWINPPQCVSIRAMDLYQGYSKAYLTGERLYVNMLVKFESVQTIKITQSFRNGPLGELQHRQPEVHEREVTEYLVLDVRTWVPGRKPKFVTEIFEGQKLEYHVQSTELTRDKKSATEEGTSESTAATPAS